MSNPQSSSLIEQLRDDIDAAFGRRGTRVKDLVNEVKLYGGEFTSTELGKVSTASPTIFITSLGFTPSESGRRIVTPARNVKLAFFILVKGRTGAHDARANRMLQAANIAEHLAAWLIKWKSRSELANGCVGMFEDVTAENKYGRNVDANALAIWLVRANIDASYCFTDGSPMLVVPEFEFTSNARIDVPAEPEPVLTVPSHTLTMNGVDPNEQE